MNHLPKVLVAFCLLSLAACEKQGPAEEAGEKLDNAIENIKDDTSDAFEDAKDELEDAAEEVENGG